MSYVDEGPRGDEAVLMLHGNPTWSFYYRDLVRELSGGIRCVVPDHIGMGLSAKPDHYDYRLQTRIADVAALVTFVYGSAHPGEPVGDRAEAQVRA